MMISVEKIKTILISAEQRRCKLAVNTEIINNRTSDGGGILGNQIIWPGVVEEVKHQENKANRITGFQ